MSTTSILVLEKTILFHNQDFSSDFFIDYLPSITNRYGQSIADNHYQLAQTIDRIIHEVSVHFPDVNEYFGLIVKKRNDNQCLYLGEFSITIFSDEVLISKKEVTAQIDVDYFERDFKAWLVDYCILYFDDSEKHETLTTDLYQELGISPYSFI